MRASFVETRSKRRIEIRAANDSSSILIANAEWEGDTDAKMKYGCESGCK